MNKRIVGKEKEALAAKLLSLHGYEVIARNYRCRSGEVDVIAKEDGYLVFIEVKYRSSLRFGEPQLAVNGHKQGKIKEVARWYCHAEGIDDYPIRYDVVAILGKKYQIIKNAFY
ncbi:putative endonuclease [Lachnospiraceae bacterium XBB1006]|nr:putative endonuclease [Lachnospiraceae bacterium XBB1006]